jgi:4-hydroxybenzoate polyprenyltransferase
MKHLKIFIQLTRLNKPIGFMLLFWPCSWGLAYAYSINQDYNLFIHYLFLFFLGSVLMRSAGCIVNDIVDKDFDKKVKRTKTRPIAAGKISIKRSLSYVLILCGLAFIILLQFNFLTILLGMGSMIFAFTYPFMKRITHWPQLFLGITFNWGLIMSWAAINNGISPEIIILYISAIFWTLGYDTIYGAQDMSDDEIIGLKSTSIKFKNYIKLFVLSCYLITSSLIIFLFKDIIGFNTFSLLLYIFFLSLVYQVFYFDQFQPKKCLKIFKANNYSGLIFFLGIFLINY